jgi:hypothetical protein
MKKLIFSLIILSFHLSLIGQHIVLSTVCDSSTKEALAYVNIGIKFKNKGTVSNTEGGFRMNFNADQLSDSLTFSFVGYETRTLSINSLVENEQDTIWLKPRIQEITEYVVSSKIGKWKTKQKGLSRNLPGAYGIVQNDTLNDIVECAQLIDLDSAMTKITQFSVFLKGVNTDTASFRINFYHFDGESPTERAVDKEILIRRKIENRWMDVDLDEYNIWLTGKIVAAIEFLPTETQKENTSLFYGGILLCKGTSYNRESSQGKWHKLDFGTYSIQITTKRFKAKK